MHSRNYKKNRYQQKRTEKGKRENRIEKNRFNFETALIYRTCAI